MLKKRIIFTLLYNNGFFVQSRNFNLQKVGDFKWIIKNYNFRNISFFIDELIILDISRDKRDINKFIYSVENIIDSCFVPVAVGGGIDSLEKAKILLSKIADKVILNTINYSKPNVIKEISEVYGEQSVLVSVDLKQQQQDYYIYMNNGRELASISPLDFFGQMTKLPFGEIILNSIDKDGTGNGLDIEIVNLIPDSFNKPIIISGGCGNSEHINNGLKNSRISAVATANLLNFVGDGLKLARNDLLKKNNFFPEWDLKKFSDLENVFSIKN